MGLYIVPFMLTSSGHASPGRVRSLLEWFESVEIWAEKGAFDRQSPTLVCYHPHGIFTLGMFSLLLSGKALFPDGVVALGAPYIKFFSPLFQCLLNSTATAPVRFESVSRQSI